MNDEKQLIDGIMKYIFGMVLLTVLTLCGTGCNSIDSNATSDGGSINQYMTDLPVQKHDLKNGELMRIVKYYRKKLKENCNDAMILAELSVKMDTDLANWQQANPDALDTDRNVVERLREHLAKACLRHYQMTEIRIAIQRVKQARTFAAYRDAADALRIQALAESRNSLWSTSERENFRNHAEEIQAAMKMEQERYTRVRALIMGELTESQIRFVNSAVQEDLTNIRSNYSRESSKWLNWCWMGCPRDNKEVIINSLVSCDRIIGTRRIDYSLLNEAYYLKVKLAGRLSRMDNEVYERHPVLPAYESLETYPCETSLLKSVDEQWYEEFTGKRQGITVEKELTATQINGQR